MVRGRVAYCSQVPWIMAGSLRDNILFGTDMEQARYAARGCERALLHRCGACAPVWAVLRLLTSVLGAGAGPGWLLLAISFAFRSKHTNRDTSMPYLAELPVDRTH